MTDNEIGSLFQLYGQDVYRYSMFKLRNKEEAEDVTSETFLRTIQNTDLKTIANMKVWLIGVARNVIYERFRLLKKQQVSTNDEEVIEGAEDTEQNVENIVLNDEMLELIKSELDSLDDDTREVLILKIWEGLKFNEIAAITTEKESTIKLRYYRGLESLKLNLGETHGKKMYSFTLPILIAGITAISKSGLFILDKGIVASIATKIGISSTLLFNASNMSNITAATATASKGFLSTTLGKVVAGIAAITTTTVVVVGTATTLDIINDDSGKDDAKIQESPVSYTAISEGKQVEDDSVDGVKYLIANSDGSSVELVYPKDWKVNVYSNGQTFGFVAPNGSALGYDFGLYRDLQSCKDTAAAEINGTYAKYKRYNDTSIEGVNWYVCEYDTEQGQYYVDNASLFTVYVNDPVDLETIDSIIKSLKVTGRDGVKSYSGVVFKTDFSYSKKLGFVTGWKTRSTFSGENFCTGEVVNFSNSNIRVEIMNGWSECIGAHGVGSEYFYSNDGKQFTYIDGVYDNGQGEMHTLTTIYTTGEDHKNLYAFRIQASVRPESVEMTKNLIKKIIESSSFDPSGLRSENFDEIRELAQSRQFYGEVFKLNFDYDIDLGAATSFTKITKYSDGRIFCSSENVSFAGNDNVRVSILRGSAECIGASGGPNGEVTYPTSKDGKTFTVDSFGANGATIVMGSYLPGVVDGYYQAVRISANKTDTSTDTHEKNAQYLEKLVTDIIQSLGYDTNGFKSENFDETVTL